jgi:hypothetical protein
MLFGRHPLEKTRRSCLLRRMSQVLAHNVEPELIDRAAIEG